MGGSRPPYPPGRNPPAALPRWWRRPWSSRDLRSADLGQRGHHPGRVLVEDLDLVILGEEIEGPDHRHQVVAGPAGLRAHRAAGPGRLGAEQHARHAALLDRCLQEVQVITAGVVEEVVAQVL